MSGIEDWDKVKLTVSEWKDKPIEERRKFCNELSSLIVEIDKSRHDNEQQINYSYRNTLVAIKRELQREIPFLFDKDDKVVIKFDRRIKGIVKELVNLSDRSILVKPIDNLYKENVIVSECMLEHDVAPAVKEGQLTLF